MNQENAKYIGEPDCRVYIVGIGEMGKRIVQANRDALLELAMTKSSLEYSFPPIIEFAYLTPEEIVSSYFDCDCSFVVADLAELNSEQQTALFNHNSLDIKFIIYPDKPIAVKNASYRSDLIWLNKENDEDTLKESILAVIECMLFPGMISSNIIDIKFSITSDSHLRKLHFARGRATGSNQTDRITEATNKAWELIPMSAIKENMGLLLVLKSGLDLELSEIFTSDNISSSYFDFIEDFNVCPGTILDSKMENEVEVILIVSERVE